MKEKKKEKKNVYAGRIVIAGGPYPVKKKKKIGMKIFKAMNWTVGIIFFVSACAVDSATWFPTIVCALSIAYLGCALYIWEALKANK